MRRQPLPLCLALAAFVSGLVAGPLTAAGETSAAKEAHAKTPRRSEGRKAAAIDPALLAGMKARSIGPAARFSESTRIQSPRRPAK